MHTQRFGRDRRQQHHEQPEREIVSRGAESRASPAHEPPERRSHDHHHDGQIADKQQRSSDERMRIISADKRRDATQDEPPGDIVERRTGDRNDADFSRQQTMVG